jgi:hypothetical protein
MKITLLISYDGKQNRSVEFTIESIRNIKSADDLFLAYHYPDENGQDFFLLKPVVSLCTVKILNLEGEYIVAFYMDEDFRDLYTHFLSPLPNNYYNNSVLHYVDYKQYLSFCNANKSEPLSLLDYVKAIYKGSVNDPYLLQK